MSLKCASNTKASPFSFNGIGVLAVASMPIPIIKSGSILASLTAFFTVCFNPSI